jgi:hypothetical protein
MSPSPGPDPSPPTPEEMATRVSGAKAAFNGAWDLIDLAERTPEQEREMLLSAAASRYLWAAAGGEGGEQALAIGDWQVAHVLSLMGAGDLALKFASAALDRVRANGWTDWRLASAEEGMARAYAAIGDRDARDRHAQACRHLLTSLEAEDQEIIGGQLATVP